MTIARILILAIVVIFSAAVMTAAYDPVYAIEPCCGYVGGKYVNLKTGKEARPPKSASTTTAPVTGADPCCGYVGGKYVNLKTGKEATLPSATKTSSGVTSVSKSTSGSTEHSRSGGGGGGGHK